MVNFIEVLRRFQLPVWNEYVGSGSPAMLFSHYPITQNTIVYMLFGFNDFTFYATKCLNMFILLVSFVYAARFLRLRYLVVLLGAFVYLSINFVLRFVIADTVGNLFVLYPLLMFFMLNILRERRRKDILIFSLCYIAWLSGNHITYVFPHVVMLLVVYWMSVFIDHGRNLFSFSMLRRYVGLALVMFGLPALAVLYQYYFAWDVLSHSNRVGQVGLIVSPFAWEAWRQLLVSFKSSSYLWMGLIALFIYSSLRILPWTRSRDLSCQLSSGKWKMAAWVIIAIIVIAIVFKMKLVSRSSIFIDYFTIINSIVFRLSLLLYLLVTVYVLRDKKTLSIGLNDCIVFVLYVSLLSYYFYSPDNIAGYDYDFFRELSIPFQVLFTFVVVYSSREYGRSNILKVVVISAVVLYFVRSHLTIPLLRFTGIIWYSVRDGSIFSLFFGILFMIGLDNLLRDLSDIAGRGNKRMVKYAQFVFLVLVLVLMARDCYAKFYFGQSNRLIFPNKQYLAASAREKLFIDRGIELKFLNKEVISLKNGTSHFFRLFTADIPDWYFLAGYWQQYKVYDAAIYDGTIPKGLVSFFDGVVLKKPPTDLLDFKNLLQCPVFTRHVHEGFRARFEEIPYSPHFTLLLLPNDRNYIKEKNMKFFWDLMQVKYLLVGPGLSDLIRSSFSKEDYVPIRHYPKLNVDLYRIARKRSCAQFALLPLDRHEDYEGVIRQLNSLDIDVLGSFYRRLIYPDDSQQDFVFSNVRRDYATRSYDIYAKKNALLIEFESVNHNWGVTVNGGGGPLRRVFGNLKGVKIGPGLNEIRLSYHPRYFKGLFWLAVICSLAYLVLVVRYTCFRDQ